MEGNIIVNYNSFNLHFINNSILLLLVLCHCHLNLYFTDIGLYCKSWHFLPSLSPLPRWAGVCFDLVFKIATLFDAVFVLNFSALLSFEFSHSDVCTTTAKLLLSSNQFLLQKISPNTFADAQRPR